MTKKLSTAKELKDLADQVISEYGQRDANLDELEPYYFLEEDKAADALARDEGIEIVHLPYGTSVIDLVQDLLSQAELTITVPALSEGSQDKKLADAAEEFLQTLLSQSERAARQSIMGRAAWLAAMRGAVAGRVIAVQDWMEKGEAGEGWKVGKRIPMLIQLRDPRYLYPAFGLDGLAFVVEQKRRTVRDVRITLGSDALPGKKPDTEVEWMEYWDDYQYCYWADGQPVEKGGKAGPWPHLYGGLPYSYEFARQTGILDPEKRARPLLKGIQAVIDRMELLDSAEATFIAQYNGDALTVYSHGEVEVDTRPGAINYLEPDEKVEWLRAGRQPIETQQAYSKYNAQFEKGTFPGTLFGQDPGRVMAGFAITQLNQSGQARLSPIVKALEDLLSTLLENGLMVAENYLADLVGGPIPFYAYSETETEDGGRYKARRENKLDARKLGGFYHVEVGLGEILPADEQANVVLAERVRSPGPDGRPLLSWETTVEKYGLTGSPSEERDRIDREAAWNEPEIVALRRALYVAEVRAELEEALLELDIDPEVVLAAMQQQAGGGPPPPEGSEFPPEGFPPGQGMIPPQMQGQLQPQLMGQMPGAPAPGELPPMPTGFQ